MSNRVSSRNIHTFSLENTVCERINQVIKTLEDQEKFIYNGHSRVVPKFDQSTFPIRLPKTPNYKALEAGFKGLEIRDRRILYHNVYMGELSYIDDCIWICKERTYEIKNKRFMFEERISLADMLSQLYEITEEQLRYVERILFLFEC